MSELDLFLTNEHDRFPHPTEFRWNGIWPTFICAELMLAQDQAGVALTRHRDGHQVHDLAATWPAAVEVSSPRCMSTLMSAACWPA